MITNEVIPDLRCPRSPEQALDIKVSQSKGNQIVDGSIKCDACGSEHQIRSGIADFVPGDIVSTSDRKSLSSTLGQWFDIVAESTFSKRWYSPENLLLSMKVRQ
jgi:hypothetical protein